MVTEDLAAMVKKQYDVLMAEKQVLMNSINEIDKKLAPVVAFINAGKMKSVEGKKRGRRRKVQLESSIEG